jgi:alkylhydroperoxidase family enzyme
VPESIEIEQLRATVSAAPSEPAALAAYLDKVRSRAYTVTDADVDALKDSGMSEEMIFEHTVAAAIAEGLRRLDAGLGAIG